MPRIVLTLSAAVLALVLLPVPGLVRFAAVGWAIWALPGWGFRNALLGPSNSRLLSVTTAAVLPWAVQGVLGTFAGALGLSPVVLTLALSVLGLLCLWVRWPSNDSFEELQTVDGSFEVGALIVSLVLFLVVSMAPPHRSLLSDVYAHVAAVRACIEEGRIFPLHEFYPPGQGTGADPRFGLGHSYDASWSQLSRRTALDTWNGMGALAVALFALSTAALSSRVASTSWGRWVAFATFVGFFGGSFYNPLRTAPYPLWLGLACVWLAIALVFAGVRGRRVWLVAVLVAGAGGMHALAFLFGALFLLVAWIVAPPSNRNRIWQASWPALVLGTPVMGLRFILSYGNTNPIHQWPWEILEWAPGWFSASPGFLLDWLLPFGLLALALVPWLVRRCRREQPMMWAVVVTSISIAWLVLPVLLTPSMKVLGFLPMRLVMTILTPLLLAGWIDELRPGRRRMILGVLLLSTMSVLTLGRVRSLWEHDSNAVVDTPSWRGLIEYLNEDVDPSAVVLSDPFSMLAVKSMAPQSIVAVPDGRSSPRDAQAIERLRDSWQAMSSTENGQRTDEVLARYGVTHVLLNSMFGQDQYSYEYPVDTASFPAQKQKFSLNSDRFQKQWEQEGLVLYRVNAGSTTWDESYVSRCVTPREGQNSTLQLSYGFGLEDPSVEYQPGSQDAFLQVRGDLVYNGTMPPPDRYLVVRLDAVEGPVPSALQFMEKPVRKILEKIRPRVYRHRWTMRLRGGACPSWVLTPGSQLPLDIELPRPNRLHPGRYRLSLQTTRNTEFTILKLKDFLRNEDSYSGPTLAEIEIAEP